MEFVRLGTAADTAYMPTDLIEGYNSLIWTERFQSPGEFELKSYEVDRLKSLLPEGTRVSHLETQEVMTVETHSVQTVGEGEDAVPEITIKGRSASVILEHRFVESKYQKKRRMRKKYTAASAVGVLLVNAVDNGSGADLTRGDDDPDTDGVKNHYDWNTKDVIPNVAVSEAVSNEGDASWWQLEQGMLYPQLMDILVDADLGLRCLRPVLPNSLKILTVKRALAERGTVVRTLTQDVAQLRFEVYSGTDRSAGDNAVQFSLLQGHILGPQYLESVVDHKTAMEVMSGAIEVKDVYRTGDGSLSGWNRKVDAFDAGTPELPDEPQKPAELRANATDAQRRQRRQDMETWIDKHAKWENKRDRIVTDFREAQTKKALRELKKRRRIDMFAGDISDLSPYRYKTHYDLGDTVMLFGDYGKKAKMIVSEFVRTEDAAGDRGFPGLVAP